MNENRPSVEQETAKSVEFRIVRDSHVRRLLRDRTEAIVEAAYHNGTHALVFLDKSARPISWLVREVWKKNHGMLNRPQIRFMNVGKPEGGRLAIDAPRSVSPDAVAELRRLFGSQFADKDVMIVDDLSATGKTLETATRVFQEAFPSARVMTTFVSDAEDMPEDRFPWSEIPGSTDVLELSETIVSHSALEHRIDPVHEMLLTRLRDALGAKARGVTMKKEIDRALAAIGNGRDLVGDLEGVLAHMQILCATEPVPVDLMSRVVTAIEAAKRAFPSFKRGTKGPSSVELYAKVAEIDVLAEELATAADFWPGPPHWGNAHGELDEMLSDCRKDAERILRPDDRPEFVASSRIAREAAAYADPARLAGLADQLRAEMKEISKMPVTKE
ncbi:MAG: hypothetical protein WCO25_01465 [Candidatus Uhrbacteria bacterium]